MSIVVQSLVDMRFNPLQSYTLGVISDTHIPDRSGQLNPRVLPILREAGVSAILHGGDISSPGVLDVLRTVAPVYAVQGNRDFLARQSLPVSIKIQAGEVEIGLTHGHGGIWRYLGDKLHFISHGIDRGYYQVYLRRIFPTAQVIVYGHTHFKDDTWSDGCLYFNPGAAGPPSFPGLRASMGLLRVGPHLNVQAEIIDL